MVSVLVDWPLTALLLSLPKKDMLLPHRAGWTREVRRVANVACTGVVWDVKRANPRRERCSNSPVGRQTRETGVKKRVKVWWDVRPCVEVSSTTGARAQREREASLGHVG